MGYQFSAPPWKPRLTGEYKYASGNTLRDRNRIGTFDQQYPGNHNAFGPGRSLRHQNITQARIDVDLAPTKNLIFLIQNGYLHIASVRDNIYASGATVLAKAPVNGFTNTDLGQEFDASGDYLLRKTSTFSLA